MIRSKSLVLLALLWAGNAAALDCENAITTMDINDCAAAQQKQVETRLNATYQDVLAFLDAADPSSKDDYAMAKVKLVEAQRAWIKFRAADCDAVYNLYASGTIRTVLWISCMQSRAEQRIGELESFVKGQGN